MNGTRPNFASLSVVADRIRPQRKDFRKLPDERYKLPTTTPWLPPGGSCHDEISALRNRYFVVTDEGWRQVGK